MGTDLSQKINKPVSTLAIIPKTGSITRLGRQAFSIMLMEAKEQGTEDPATGMFSSPLHSIIEGFDGNKDSMTVLKATLRSMVSSVIEWQSPTDGEASEWDVCAFLSAAKIKVIKGENHIFWAYAPNLKDKLLNPQVYAQLRRATISKAKSHAGLALYENCIRYKDVPSRLTSEHPWEWWVPVLRGKPTKPGAVLEYGIFKRDTLNKAIAEVNEISEITVRLIEKKAGKSVTTIQFEVIKKPMSIEPAEEPRSPIAAASLVKAEKMGIPSKIADDHFGRYGDQALLKALNKLAIRLEQFSSPVGNKLAYLKSILENAVVEDPQDIEPKEMTDAPVIEPSNTNIHLAEEKQAVEQGSSQFEIAKREIASLQEDERRALIAELKSHAIEQKWSARMMMRIEAAEFENPMIQGALVKIHWKMTRGADWIN